MIIPLCSDRTRAPAFPADVSSQDRRGAEHQALTINPPATGRKHKKNNYPASRRILESVSFGELLTSARHHSASPPMGTFVLIPPPHLNQLQLCLLFIASISAGQIPDVGRFFFVCLFGFTHVRFPALSSAPAPSPALCGGSAGIRCPSPCPGRPGCSPRWRCGTKTPS